MPNKVYQTIPHEITNSNFKNNLTFLKDFEENIATDFIVKQVEKTEDRVIKYHNWLKDMELKYKEVNNYDKSGAYHTAEAMFRMMFEDVAKLEE